MLSTYVIQWHVILLNGNFPFSKFKFNLARLYVNVQLGIKVSRRVLNVNVQLRIIIHVMSQYLQHI